MKQEFLVLKDGGNYYPMAFITPADEAGKIRANLYKKDEGESIVKVCFVEIED